MFFWIVFHFHLFDGVSLQDAQVFVDFVFSEVYYYYYTVLEFFTSVSADGLSLEFEWQQVSSSLQDSFQDSSRS